MNKDPLPHIHYFKLPFYITEISLLFYAITNHGVIHYSTLLVYYYTLDDSHIICKVNMLCVVLDCWLHLQHSILYVHQ